MTLVWSAQANGCFQICAKTRWHAVNRGKGDVTVSFTYPRWSGFLCFLTFTTRYMAKPCVLEISGKYKSTFFRAGLRHTFGLEHRASPCSRRRPLLLGRPYTWPLTLLGRSLSSWYQTTPTCQVIPDMRARTQETHEPHAFVRNKWKTRRLNARFYMRGKA